MDRLIELAAIVIATALSLPVAIVLQWLCLRGVFAVMPAAVERKQFSAPPRPLRAAAWLGFARKVLPAAVRAGNH